MTLFLRAGRLCPSLRLSHSWILTSRTTAASNAILAPIYAHSSPRFGQRQQSTKPKLPRNLRKPHKSAATAKPVQNRRLQPAQELKKAGIQQAELPKKGLKDGYLSIDLSPTYPLPSYVKYFRYAVFGTIILAIGAIGTSVVLEYYRGQDQPSLQESQPRAHRQNIFAMTADTPAGRPGNLTLEQEAKLRELWLVTGKLFGVVVDFEQPTAATAASESAPVASPTAAEAPKRSRLGFLRRGKAADEPASPATTSGSSTPTASDIVAGGSAGNDKYGLSTAFKEAMANSTPEELRDAFWDMVKGDHPDGLLLRFLRARKWDVNAAVVMAVSALHWRIADSKVDSDIMLNGEEGSLKLSQSSDPKEKKRGDDFMVQIRQGKSFLHGRDKEGRPCCFVRVRLHHPGDQDNEGLERFTVYTIETARLMLSPPVDTATVIFDMTNFGLSNMDNAPVKFLIKCFEANYPESLGAVLVHSAPWVFQGVWRLVRGWLDPVVAGKVHFTNTLEDLEQYLHKDDIIKELGGPHPYTWEYIEPVAGENDRMKDTATRDTLQTERKTLAKQYEQSIKEWATLPAEDGEKWQAARGARDGIAAKLHDNYWKLDPYVRARSVYDRNGEVKGPGAVAASAAAAAADSELD